MKGAFLATAAAALAGTALADGAHMRRGHDAFHQRRAVQAEPEETCGCTTEVVTVWGSPTLVPVAAPTTVTSEAVTTLHSTSYTTVTVVASESAATETVTTAEGAGATGITGGAAGSASPSESTTPVGATGGAAGSASPSTTEGVGATGAAGGSVGEISSTPVAAASTSSQAVPTPETTTFSSTGVYTIPASTVTVSDTTTVLADTTTSLASGTQTYGGVTTIVETSTTFVCPYATVSSTGSTVTSVIATTTYVCPSAGTYTIAPTTTYVPSNTVVTYATPTTVYPGTYTHSAEIVTVTVTDYTYTCPFANANEPTSTVVSTSAAVTPTAAAATTTAVAETTTAAPVTTSAAAGTTTVAGTTSSVQSSSVSSATAAVSSGVSASGNSMGMTYTPYSNSGGCKSKSTIESDIATIANKGFTHIRVYSTDCSTLEYVGAAAKEYGLKMILGVYISSTGTSGAQDQVTAITEWGEWSLVTLIVVGNEAIQDGYTTAAELASFITSCKSTFSAAGYTGQITTTEPVNIWQEYGSSNLCSVVDVLGANIHPFFNSETTAAEAGTFAQSEVTLLKKICTDMDVINLETGWPSAGNANGAAVPGTTEQTTAIKGIRESVGELSVFFSYANDLWKDPGEYDVEQYWGCIDQF
ncbi:putative cell wall glucanase (Scw11) [Aspergillus ibericus CBS 121593]|uniref:Probable beta-glucosidase btgE n=1 Tax=Aspergillus ibericus CBS 121593 TaxID=1448316 RepID=A0A395HBF4_9EURO|nr:glycoside hydrolase [Aspergillus ibericus CBS 121593]RAL03544.1 glycoside hydrolase [Aspergillus ibericus CBS 121593]